MCSTNGTTFCRTIRLCNRTFNLVFPRRQRKRRQDRLLFKSSFFVEFLHCLAIVHKRSPLSRGLIRSNSWYANEEDLNLKLKYFFFLKIAKFLPFQSLYRALQCFVNLCRTTLLYNFVNSIVPHSKFNSVLRSVYRKIKKI